MRALLPISTSFMLLALAGMACAEDSPPPPSFQRDIFPILERRCVKCHNAEKQEAKLGLHDRAAIERGGQSGRKIVNVPLAENELWHRVAGKDAEVRMPAEGPPLTTEELALIQRWAEAGAPWTVAMRPPPPPENSLWMDWLVALTPKWLDEYLNQLQELRIAYGSVFYLLLALLLAAIFVERTKLAAADLPAEPSEPERFSLAAWLRKHVTSTTYLLAVGGIAAWGTWLYIASLHARETELVRKVETLEGDVKRLLAPMPGTAADSYIPERPRHPPRMGGTYYRGNDERSPQLFNGGFYRTAVMELALCDLSDKPLAWGDKLPPRDIFIRLEIQRAPKAAPALFTPAIMAKAFLSPLRPAVRDTAITQKHFPARTLVEGEKWVLHAPLKLPAGNPPELLEGEVFLYNCQLAADTIPERPHFGIRYRIGLKDGVIQPGSELWMGSLYPLSNAIFPPRDKILPNEWFDSRPIPEIEGENTADPQLLGVEEHRAKL